MLGFEIGRLELEETIQRIDHLKDLSILPLDDDGSVILEDQTSLEAAREMRLLLQRVLDLDTKKFLVKMRELYFHLFSIDHGHFRDLLLQAARRDEEATRDFCLGFILSDEIVFLDDQKNLSDLFDILTFIGIEAIPANSLQMLRESLKAPFRRRPSVLERIIRFLGPSLTIEDLHQIRILFEMDLIPQSLPWSDVLFHFAQAQLPAAWLKDPEFRPSHFNELLKDEDLDWLRWGVGIDGSPLQIAMRFFGCMIVAGPDALELFYRVTETLPDPHFSRSHFETGGQEFALEKAFVLLKNDILREFHRSTEWFEDIQNEDLDPTPSSAPFSSWPARLRLIPLFWKEFKNPILGSDFFESIKMEVDFIEQHLLTIEALLKKRALPSSEDLQTGELAFDGFLVSWQRVIEKVCPRIDIIP